MLFAKLLSLLKLDNLLFPFIKYGRALYAGLLLAPAESFGPCTRIFSGQKIGLL